MKHQIGYKRAQELKKQNYSGIIIEEYREENPVLMIVVLFMGMVVVPFLISFL